MKPNPFGGTDQVKMNPPNSPAVLDRPAGPTDPAITFLSVQDARKRPLGLFANYSLHYVGATPRGLISADYYGEFARLMPQRLGEPALVAMMSNGTSGDINNTPFGTIRPPREPMEQARIVAQEAADAVWFAGRGLASHDPRPVLGMTERVLKLKYRRPSKEQMLYAKAVLALKDPEAIKRLPALAEPYARRTLAAYERPDDTVDSGPAGGAHRRLRHRGHPLRDVRRDRTGAEIWKPLRTYDGRRARQRPPRLPADAGATRTRRL